MTATVFSPIARRTSSIPRACRRANGARRALGRVFGVADVRDRIGVPFLVATTMALKSWPRRRGRGCGAAAGPCPAPPCRQESRRSPRRWRRGPGRSKPVRAQLLDVDDDVDLAGAAAAEADLADAVDGLDDARDLLVGELGQRPQAHRVGRDDQRHHRVGVGVDLGDDRRQQLRRRALDRAGHLLADVVGGVVEVALEHEADGDPGRCLRRCAPESRRCRRCR